MFNNVLMNKAVFTAFVIALLYVLVVTYTRHAINKINKEKQELAKWQGELERRADEIRRLQEKRYM